MYRASRIKAKAVVTLSINKIINTIGGTINPKIPYKIYFGKLLVISSLDSPINLAFKNLNITYKIIATTIKAIKSNIYCDIGVLLSSF